MFVADDHAVHSPRAVCPFWSTYTTQTHGSVRDTLPHTVVGVWWISADGTFSPRNLITMRCSTLRGTFCSLITLATPREDLTGSNPSRRVEVVASLSQGRTAAVQCTIDTKNQMHFIGLCYNSFHSGKTFHKMEPLIALPYDTIICTISLLQCWQQQVLSTDFHPCGKVLARVGHLPTVKLGVGEQNS